MKHRRTIFKVLCLLAAGATLNVAVAWTSAAFVGFADVTDGVHANQYSLNTVWAVSIKSKATAQRVESHKFHMQGVPAGARQEASELIPQWLTVDGKLPEGTLRVDSDHEARGFPCLSLWSTPMELVGTTDGLGHLVPPTGSIRVPGSNYSGVIGQIPRVLPLLPIWPGFAINTMFYAGVLWVLFGGPFALRRMIRRRRGRCPHCGYPIGQSPVCTECGAAVTPKASS